MLNQMLLVAYVAVIVLLSLKLRQGMLSGFVLSDRNIAFPAAIGICLHRSLLQCRFFLRRRRLRIGGRPFPG